jgi:hypothetical protein
MIMGVEDKMAPTLDYLQQRLGFNDKELSRFVQQEPNLLVYRPQEGLEPKIQYLERRLLLDKDGLRKIVNRSPTLLALSQEDNIEPKLKWLEERLDLNQQQSSRLVLMAPNIIQHSIPDKLQPTLEWLEERLDLKDNDALRTFILKFPTLCSRTIANLSEKLEFYESLLGVDGARSLILEAPGMFTYSLEKRLRPRLQAAEEEGLTIDYSLVRRMGKYTDSEWEISLDYQMTKIQRQSELQ